MKRFITDHDEQLLVAERQELSTLRSTLTGIDASSNDLGMLDRALRQLDELFLLVIVGEFNAGKSAFINALLGKKFLSEGVTPTTTEIHLLKFGEQVNREHTEPDVQLVTYPVDWLREINIVDTPGTNAVIQRHQEITEDFVPRADLVLFVTSADRPFSESERAFMERIREWGKKVVVVVNKIDMLESPDDVAHIVEFVRSHGRELLGSEPTVFPVSSRLARQAKEAIDADQRNRLWLASQFEPLESYILRTLDERERLRLKLANPLGIAGRLADHYLAVVRERRELLREDVVTTQTIETQLQAYEADMRHEFRYHLSHIENVLYGMAERGDAFFDETIRLARIFDMVNADRMRGMFEREVVADTSAQVESQTRDLIDWLVEHDYRQWQAVMEYLNRRAARHQDQIIGSVGGQFEYNRQALLQSVGRAAREAVATYDKDAEAKKLAESVQSAVAQVAIVEVGAVGLGTLLVKLLATTVADVSGLLMASAIAALGLYLIPNKRRQAKSELHARISELRTRLSDALTLQFEGELTEALGRIRRAVRPYTRFVETQQARLAQSEKLLLETQSNLTTLSSQVADLNLASQA